MRHPHPGTKIEIFDENSVLLRTITPTGAFVFITENRYPGETLIGSVLVTSNSGGDVVIDELTYGFLELDALIACVIDEPTAAASEFVCVLTDPASGESNASAQGTIQVASGDQVSGDLRKHILQSYNINRHNRACHGRHHASQKSQ